MCVFVFCLFVCLSACFLGVGGGGEGGNSGEGNNDLIEMAERTKPAMSVHGVRYLCIMHRSIQIVEFLIIIIVDKTGGSDNAGVCFYRKKYKKITQ